MKKGFISTLLLGTTAVVITIGFIFISAKLGYEKELTNLTNQVKVLEQKSSLVSEVKYEEYNESPKCLIRWNREHTELSCLKLENENLLGTITTTGNFPTSLNNFQDGDVINAGDWNNIETAIGTRTSATSTTIFYQINASTTNGSLAYRADNPLISNATGSLSTLANTTGQIPVEKGGMETDSLTLNNVILGNGTSSPQFVAPSTNGNVLTSDGSTWISTSTGNLLLNKLIDASSTITSTFSSTATTTLMSVTVASTTISFTKYTGLTARLYFSRLSTNDASSQVTLYGIFNNATFASTTLSNGDAPGYIDVSVFSSTSTGSYIGNMMTVFSQIPSGNLPTLVTSTPNPQSNNTLMSFGNFTVAATSTAQLQVRAVNSLSGANDGIRIQQYYVNYFTQ